MPSVANFPTAIYLCNAVSGTGLQPNILDATDALTPGLPMPIQIIISATATVQILGALDCTSAGVLNNPLDLSGGGFSASNMYDLIISVPLYQVNITANTGTVTVKVGRGSTQPGDVGKLHLLSFTTNATQGL